MSGASPRFAVLRRVAFVLALAGFVAYGHERWESRNPFDFYQFWLVGRAAADPRIDNVYSDRGQALVLSHLGAQSLRSGSPAEVAGAHTWTLVGMQPTGTPFFYSVFALAGSPEFARDYERFRLVSLVLYVSAIVALAAFVGHPPWVALLLVAVFTHLSWPFYTDSGFGNAGRLQLGLVAGLVYLLARDTPARNVASGVVYGLLVLFKPTVVYVGPLVALAWLGERKRQRLLQTGAGGVLGLAIGALTPLLLFGESCSWSEWRHHFPRLMFTERYLGSGFLGELLGLDAPAVSTLFGLGLFAWLGGSIFVAARSGAPPAEDPSRPRVDELTLVALGLALYVLSGPIVHAHYFLLCVPLAIVALRPGQPAWRFALAGFGILLMGGHPWLRRLGLTAAEYNSLWSFLGAWILFVLVARELRFRSQGAVSAPAGDVSAPFRSERIGG